MLYTPYKMEEISRTGDMTTDPEMFPEPQKLARLFFEGKGDPTEI